MFWKEIEGIITVASASVYGISVFFGFLGFLLFRRISDKGAKDIPRDNRRFTQIAGAWFVAGGLGLAAIYLIWQIAWQIISKVTEG